MGRTVRLAGDRRAASGGAGLFALAAVVLLLSVEVPAHPWSPDPSQDLRRLADLLDTEERHVRTLVVEAWGAAPPGDLPSVRGRVVVDGVRVELAMRYPVEADSGAVVRFSAEMGLTSGPEILADVVVSVVGRMSGRLASAGLTRDVAFSVPDPSRAMVRSVVEAAVFRGIENPYARAGSAFRAGLLEVLSTVGGSFEAVAPAAVARALDQAARAAESGLGLRPTDLPAEGRASPRPPPADPLGIVRAIGHGPLLDFLWGSCDRTGCPSGIRTLLRALAGQPGTLRAVVEHTWNPAAQTAAPFSSSSEALLALFEAARSFLLSAFRDLVDAVQGSWSRWDTWNAGRLAPPGPSGPSHIVYRASNVTIVKGRELGPAIEGGRVHLPFEVQVTLAFDLVVAVALPLPDGHRFVEDHRRRVEVEVDVGRPGPSPGFLLATRSESPIPAFPMASTVAGALDLIGLAHEWALEFSERITRLRDTVAERLEARLASAVSRLVFRVVDGAIDGDTNRTVRNVFKLLSNLLEDDLERALTVNFTAFGRSFSLVPDPLGKQVTLTHREGAHTFGIRVRHISVAQNPLIGRYGDALSLAIEILWSYREGPVSADLVLDPFMRSGQGLLRFTLVSTVGRGFVLDLVAPHVTRVRTVFEASLSQVIPGGLPLFVTPTGGVVALDLAARVEFLELRPTTVAKWVVEAMESAWLDTVERETVGEVWARLWQRDTLVQLAGRFLQRLADVVAREASRLLSRVEVAASLGVREAAGLAGAFAEFSLTVLEPVVVFREMASNVAALARAGRPASVPGSIAEALPETVHTRVGVTTRFRLASEPGAYLPGASDLLGLPDAELEVRLFESLGSLATWRGRGGIRSLERAAVSWDGFVRSPAKLLPHTDIDRNDRLDLFQATARSMVGQRILISEVWAAPEGRDAALEFVELYNPGFAEARLDGWALRDASGRRFALPEGTRVAPGAFLVLARSLGGFERAFHQLPDVSTLTLALNDRADALELVNSEGWTSDRVSWGGRDSLWLVPAPGESIARRPAPLPPSALPASALRWTGSLLDFALAPPSPGGWA